MQFPFPLLQSYLGAAFTAWFATATGGFADISDVGNIHSSGTFTVPSAWNGRKVRVSGQYRKEAGGNVTLEITKGGGGVAGLPKSTCETNSQDEAMSVHTAPLVVATGDTFTVSPSVSFGTDGNALAIQLLPSGIKGCLVNRITTGYATGSTAFTPVQWNNEVYDTDGFHDNSTNPSRITIPSGSSGLVRLCASIECTGSGAELGITFYKNGSKIANYDYDTENVTANISAVSAPIPCTTGDYFEVAIRATSSPTVSVSNNSWFSVEELDSSLVYSTATHSATSLSSGSFVQLASITVPAGMTKCRAGFWSGKTSTTGTYAARIRKNGSDFQEGVACQSNSAAGEYVHGWSVPFDVTPGDTITLWGYTNAGAQNATGMMWIEEVATVIV